MTNSQTGQATSAVRPGNELNVATLEAYLIQHAGFKGRISVSQFKHGQSNPTYLLQDGDLQQYVLRKKPAGALLSSTAHAVEREYRILRALGENTDVPVPKVFILCEDVDIIGTPFYVMEYLKGRVFEDMRMPFLSAKDREQCWFSAIETLAKLHNVDYRAIGLHDYGRSSKFYARQMRSLGKVSRAQAAAQDEETGELVGPIPRLIDMFAWFEKNQPPDRATLVHGDFKIDNLIFHPTEPRVIGILDWELSTVGHPLSDLANLLQPFYFPATGFGLQGLKGAKNPLPIPGTDDLMRHYCAIHRHHFPIDRWMFAVAFSFFRAAVILQGIAARLARKQASSDHAKKHAVMFKPVSDLVLEIVDQGDLLPISKL